MNIIYFLSLLVNFYTAFLVMRVIFSWIQMDPYNPVAKIVYSMTEPLLGGIRRNLPAVVSGIDFSPLIALLLIQFIFRLIVKMLV